MSSPFNFFAPTAEATPTDQPSLPTAKDPFLYDLYPYGQGQFTRIAIWVEPSPYVGNKQMLCHAYVKLSANRWSARAFSASFDQIKIEPDPATHFVKCFGINNEEPNFLNVITPPFRVQQFGDEFARVGRNSPGGTKPLGRPRKDPNDLAPSTRALYVRQQKMAEAKRLSSKCGQRRQYIFDNLKLLQHRLESYLNEDHTHAEAREYFRNDLASGYFFDYQLHTNDQVARLQSPAYPNLPTYPNWPDAEELPDWIKLREELTQAIAFFNNLLIDPTESDAQNLLTKPPVPFTLLTKEQWYASAEYLAYKAKLKADYDNSELAQLAHPH